MIQTFTEKLASPTSPLTSVQLLYGEPGRLAVEYLCRAEDAPAQLKLTGRLKVRRSTKAD